MTNLRRLTEKRAYKRHAPGKRCRHCSKDMTGMPLYGRRIFCSDPCRVDSRRAALDDVVSRFWSKVEKRGDDECWGWLAQKRWDGYGRFVSHYKPIWAHRFSWELHNGRKIEKGEHVLHSCDNPACTNPKHLRIGTHAENMADLKHRHRNPHYSLTAEQVREVRAALTNYHHGLQAELAEKYGVSYTVISDIKLGTTYQWIK